jgi:hypothetical protein
MSDSGHTGVDSGVDVGQQPDTGSLTDVISAPINAQQPRFGAEPTATKTTEPQQPAEPTGPGLGTPTVTTQEPPTADRLPRLFGEDEEDDEKDPDNLILDETFTSGILDAESVFGQSDEQSDTSTTAVNDILGR